MGFEISITDSLSVKLDLASPLGWRKGDGLPIHLSWCRSHTPYEWLSNKLKSIVYFLPPFSALNAVPYIEFWRGFESCGSHKNLLYVELMAPDSCHSRRSVNTYVESVVACLQKNLPSRRKGGLEWEYVERRKRKNKHKTCTWSPFIEHHNWWSFQCTAVALWVGSLAVATTVCHFGEKNKT